MAEDPKKPAKDDLEPPQGESQPGETMVNPNAGEEYEPTSFTDTGGTDEDGVEGRDKPNPANPDERQSGEDDKKG